jgi:hypothetical protein
VVFRPLRDAPPIAVHLIWRRHDPHPATFAAVALLTGLYQGTGRVTARGPGPRAKARAPVSGLRSEGARDERLGATREKTEAAGRAETSGDGRAKTRLRSG